MDTTRLLDLPHFSPLFQKCLSWADDGVLAVAGTEHVALLGIPPLCSFWVSFARLWKLRAYFKYDCFRLIIVTASSTLLIQVLIVRSLMRTYAT